ncbi:MULTISPECIES: lipopolysaccharide biosynthesis protein [Pseudomonas]|uniref:Oligosaccharide flippase family protein n=1 Tax=Pseudomonas azadiae TaxID=2843612 RepID=A0ABS6P396_9PSED|nr:MULTISPECIES: oligosaccharide flippase family protein [Pseudomonas]MBV4454517.1 oligosaccharide flippase family protein [Pseudomonas azadiae]NMF39683.1 oligosaccharide flippase family protein [Pseudomonas sp. SWRI 103]
MLYAGRSSSLLVAFLFLPLYSRLLGSSQFGIVAVMLSLQALLVMMDLGMSTLTSREVSVATSTNESLLTLVRTSELSLTGFYALLLIIAVTLKLLYFGESVSWVVVIGAVLLFWLLVMQNLYYCSLIARRSYTMGSGLQIVGVVVRACVTAVALSRLSATLEVFIMTQLIVTVLHWGWSRYILTSALSEGVDRELSIKRPTLADALALTKMGGALVLFSAAGAAVTQLDKPIISMFASASSVAPYYLASLLCMTPISILAGPVSQYFQPIFLREAAQDKVRGGAKKTALRFALSVFIVTAVPTLILWWFRVPIIDLWMGPGTNNRIIANYVAILLPGLAIGAFGFVPYSQLIYAKDYRFQAVMSACLTVVTLLLATVAAVGKNVEAVCYVYSAYHTASTVVSWIRASTLPDVALYARSTALLVSTLMLASITVLAMALYILI